MKACLAVFNEAGKRIGRQLKLNVRLASKENPPCVCVDMPMKGRLYQELIIPAEQLVSMVVRRSLKDAARTKR